ncbi:hypothetical protein [Kutzneria kofuensis]|uniref:hypothetical protein n=1 Tax=Kutzneria kofuensis TaxID=103725 RepID=UPI0031EADB1F
MRPTPRCGRCGSGWERAGVPSLATRSHRRHRPHVTFALGAPSPGRPGPTSPPS